MREGKNVEVINRMLELILSLIDVRKSRPLFEYSTISLSLLFERLLIEMKEEEERNCIEK